MEHDLYSIIRISGVLLVLFAAIASLADEILQEDDVPVNIDVHHEHETAENIAPGVEMVYETSSDYRNDERPLESKLYQLDPVEVGFVRELDIVPGRTVRVKTAAVKPPLFEIYNLFSEEDCDHLIKLGEEKGLVSSGTVSVDFDKKYGVYLDDGGTLAYDEKKVNESFNEFDLDQSGFIDHEEVRRCLPGLDNKERELSLPQVLRLYVDLDLDSDSNGMINLKEFWAMQERNISSQVQDWLRRLDAGEIDPKAQVRSRISEQAWLDWMFSEDKLLSKLSARLAALTNLHPKIIKTSEKIQVARYYPGGHYHAHYDTSDLDPNKNCIHTLQNLEKVGPAHPKGRLCRYITIMTYLTDVEGGGETAFPLADNATFDEEVYNATSGKMMDLTNHCHEGNLVVRPEKGKSVMWYNHWVDPETGWLGQKNEYSLHGGCDVTQGDKWIANNWITVDDIPTRQVEFHKTYFPVVTPPSAPQPVTNTEPSTVESSTVPDQSAIVSDDVIDDDKLDDSKKDEL